MSGTYITLSLGVFYKIKPQRNCISFATSELVKFSAFLVPEASVNNQVCFGDLNVNNFNTEKVNISGNLLRWDIIL